MRAINVGSFDLGEADRVLTVFSSEKGLLKAVAKGARKPGSKMSGRSDPLCVNDLLLSSGRTFEIISQAETVESFRALRADFARLSYGLYYAELIACFAPGLEHESSLLFDELLLSLRRLSDPAFEALHACLEFEFWLLDFLGYKPELSFCIHCRDPLHDYNLSRFVLEYGGILCSACFHKERQFQVREQDLRHGYGLGHRHAAGTGQGYVQKQYEAADKPEMIHITPLVWKVLVQVSESSLRKTNNGGARPALQLQVSAAAQRLLKAYLEIRAGKRFRSLDLINQLESSIH